MIIKNLAIARVSTKRNLTQSQEEAEKYLV